MYKIFVGNKPIVLTTELEPETNFKNFSIDSVDINKVLAKLKKDKYGSVRLVGTDKDVLLKKFLSLLPNVIAGGGKVYNQKNEILFIFRNGKWDLPKGKTEPKETINQTALREVEEETNLQVSALKLIGVYDFQRMNQVIIAYHALASGTVKLSPELAEYKMFNFDELVCWPAGTGYALGDWLRTEGIEPKFMTWEERDAQGRAS